MDLSKFVTGGATRPDSLTGFQPDFARSLAAMFAAAPPEVQSQLRISSGYRSPQRQAELWEGALKKYGSPEAARKWVAPPGRSQHNHGNAADLRYLNPTALDWAHKNAQQFGLNFPLGNENWHIELAGARDAGHSPNDGHKHDAPVQVAAAQGPAVPLAQQFAQAAQTQQPQQLDDIGLLGGDPLLGDALAQSFAAFGQQREKQDLRAEKERLRRQALFGDPNLAGAFA